MSDKAVTTSVTSPKNPEGQAVTKGVPLKGEPQLVTALVPVVGGDDFNLALWLDPEAYYDGPVTADLSDLDPRDTAAFWAEAETGDRDAMRTRWPDYRGKVPPDLARAIIDDIEARRSQCS